MNGIKYLGDSEIEQPWGSVFRDQDVARFQVAMHHELAVSIGNCFANIPEKLQAVLYRNFRFTAIDVNRQPVLDEVHHQIGLSCVSQTGINQSHDPGMIQVRQDLPFIQKPQLQVAGVNRSFEKLDGAELPYVAVVPLGKIDEAKAPFAQTTQELPRPNLPVFE